jgi:hypothetical protein
LTKDALSLNTTQISIDLPVQIGLLVNRREGELLLRNPAFRNITIHVIPETALLLILKEHNMKKSFKLITLIGLMAFVPMFMGCATPYPVGGLYTELKLPVATGTNVNATKTGTAECMSILGLIATGDASLNAAMKNGNITRISHVDWEARNILGIIGNYKLTVYGE